MSASGVFLMIWLVLTMGIIIGYAISNLRRNP